MPKDPSRHGEHLSAVLPLVIDLGRFMERMGVSITVTQVDSTVLKCVCADEPSFIALRLAYGPFFIVWPRPPARVPANAWVPPFAGGGWRTPTPTPTPKNRPSRRLPVGSSDVWADALTAIHQTTQEDPEQKPTWRRDRSKAKG